MPTVGTRAYPFSIGNARLPVARAKMKYIDYAAYLLIAVCVASYFYSIGYKDGKREATAWNAKWRKMRQDDN